jgi:hypothetical protein
MLGRRSLAAWAAAFAVFAAVRIAAVVDLPTGSSDDTYGYLRLSFTGHGRPWTVPLLYSVLSADSIRIAAQCAIAIVCWCALAYVAASLVQRRWLRAVIAGGILLVGVNPQITRWDHVLLSESLALSLTAAVIACWLLFAKRPSIGTTIAVWMVTVLWAFTRSANLLLLPMLVVVLAVSLVWRSDRAKRGVLVLALVPLAIWGVISVRNDPGINEFNMYSIIEVRVFGSASATRYFAEHGMPVNNVILRSRGLALRNEVPPELLRYARVPAHFKVPAVVLTGGRPFVRWMRNEGLETYLRWLASRPGFVVTDPLNHLDEMVARKLKQLTPPFQSRRVVPTFVTSVVFESYALYLVALAAAMLTALAAVLLKLRSGPLAVAWCVIGLSVALFYVAWFGSAIESARHALVASMGSRVGLLLVFALTADLYLTARAENSATAERFLTQRLKLSTHR